MHRRRRQTDMRPIRQTTRTAHPIRQRRTARPMDAPDAAPAGPKFSELLQSIPSSSPTTNGLELPTPQFRFTDGSAKLQDGATLIFDLPAGWTCPGAAACLAKASRETGRITDGEKDADGFRC